VPGVYKFVLKVWTNTDEFSQSIVTVYVHSFLNANLAAQQQHKSSTNKLLDVNSQNLINQNLIEIKLDIEPSLFSEYVKERFLTKFQMLLQEQKVEFKLDEPNVILINSRISADGKKSIVVLELIVTDVIDGHAAGIQMSPKELLQTHHGLNDLLGDNRKIIASSVLIKQLRRNQNLLQKSLKKVETVLAYLKISMLNPPQHHDTLLDYFDIKVLTISQVTCTNDEIGSLSSRANFYNCSNHGKCDQYSHKCICDKFWTSNFYLHYLDYESDITNGNNCGNVKNQKK
jgi:hypothetical protein